MKPLEKPSNGAFQIIDPPACFSADDVGVLVLRFHDAAGNATENPATLYTAGELAEISQMRTEQRRQEKLAGKLAVKWLACDLLMRWFGETGDPSIIEVLAPGSPVRVGAPANPHLDGLLKTLHFSLSHSGGVACAAASRQPVGIDVEQIVELTPEMELEIGVAATPDKPLSLAAFTQKEAVLKAAGIGLRENFSAVELGVIAMGSPSVSTYCGLRYRVVSAVDQDCVYSLACHIPGGNDRKEVTPSAIQEVMWFMNQIEGFGATHNVGRTIRLRGFLDVQLLSLATQHVVDRHEALRTVFHEQDGQCRADVLAELKAPMGIESFRHLPADAALAGAESRCDEEMARRFDLVRGPLFRCILLEVEKDDHIFLMVFHHTIIDGPAILVFRRELFLCYRELLEQRTPALPPLPFQYGEYARQQRTRLTPERMDALLDYWRMALDGSPACLNIPRDHPRPPFPTFEAGNVDFSITGEIIRALRDLRTNEKVSLFATFLTAFEVFLSRLSGQDDVVIGVPFVDRRDRDTQQLIGCFVNLLPVRLKIQGSPPFRDLLRQSQATLKAAIAHHELPFSVLAEKLAPRHSNFQPPIFQASILLLREETDGKEIAGIMQDYHKLPAGGTACDLTLYLTISEEDGQGRFEYNSNLFEESTVRSMADQFLQFLGNIASHPDTVIPPATNPVDDRQTALPPALPSAGQSELLPETWNIAASVFRPKLCIHELFEKQAEKTPDHVAIVFDGRNQSYRQLNEQANRLAHYLCTLGVEPESRVGICVERSLEMVVGVLATLKAGGAYVPMDPAYPKERLAYMLKDAQPRVILTQEFLRHALPEHSLPVVYLDALPGEMARGNPGNPAYVARPENLAYIIYTSGSTGQPKGVMVEHRSLVNYTMAAMEKYGIGTDDRMLQFASLNFDASAEEIFPALASGAALVLRTGEMIKTAATFLELCHAWKVTLLDLPTAYWSHLVTQMGAGNLSLPPAIRLVIIGGESALPVKVAAWQKQVGPAVRLFNTYGPTEATIVATWCELTSMAVESGSSGVVPIGRPVPNIHVHVLDAYIQPVSIGVVGELHIGGAGLARGYLNQPELTAERFITNPLDPRHSDRLYKTGDRARFLSDGNLEFMGRQDNQVKIRGFRIELNEIETTLARHPELRENVVVIREDDPDDKRLVVYAVPSDRTTPPTTEALRHYLKQTLPDHMVPSAFVIMGHLPLGPNGKIDRKALPVPDWNLMVTATQPAAPRNFTEEILAAIWSDVLGIRQVGIHDNFFDRGGHSLLGVRLITQIRAAFQSDLPLRSLFQAPTIAELAALIKSSSPVDDRMAYLLELQKGRSGLPLFFIPGGGGGENALLVYARMLRQLGNDLPIYGFRVCGMDGRTRPHHSAKSLAATFLTELRMIQPKGPYFLAGECLGGILAYEMAQQLQADGDRIAFLGMLDTSCPNRLSFCHLFMKRVGLRVKQCLDLMTNASTLRQWIGLPGAMGVTLLQLENDWGYIRSHPRPGDDPLQRQLQLKRVGWTYAHTLLRYQPKPYDGRITMLLTDNFPSLSRPPSEWSNWARGGLEIHRVPGDHNTYIRDLSTTTGLAFKADLFRARELESRRH